MEIENDRTNVIRSEFIKALTKETRFSSHGRTQFYTPQTGYFWTITEFPGPDPDQYIRELKTTVRIVQAAIRERKEGGRENLIYGYKDSTKENESGYMSFEELLDSVVVPQNIVEKMDKLLTQLGEKTNGNPGISIELVFEDDFPLAYAVDSKDFIFLLKSLREKGCIDISFHSGFNVLNRSPEAIFNYAKGCSVNLLLEGWERIEELKKGNKESKQGFVACWFHNDHKKYGEAIVRGIKNTKIFDPMIIRDEDYSETIFEKGLGEIKRSRFLVVDLSGSRHSVIFETGFAFGLGLDVIFVMKKKELESDKVKKEFYTKNYKIIPYSDEKELEEVVERAIRARIT